MATPQYKELFKDMGWDDVYDRYQSHPDYDITFRMTLAKQFRDLNFFKP